MLPRAVSLPIALLTLLFTAPAWADPSPKAEEKPALPVLKELLPEGAIVRLGSSRMRHPNTAHALTYSADGKLLASAGLDGARVWDTATGRLLRHLVSDHGVGGAGAYVFAVAFSPDRKTLATASVDGHVYLWDVDKGAKGRRLTGPANGAASVVFSADGKLVAAGSRGGHLRVWNAATGEVSADLKYDAQFAPVVALAFTADDKAIIAQSMNEMLVRKVAGGKITLRIETAAGPVAVSADRKRLAWGPGTYGQKDAIQLYDLVTGKTLPTRLSGHNLHILSLAFAPDGKSLVAVSADNSIRSWDLETKKEIRRFSGQPEWTMVPLAFAPDGKTLAAGSGTGPITLWDVATGNLREGPEAHAGYPVAAVLAPDGKLLVSADSAAVVRLWDVTSGKFLRRLGTSAYRGGTLGSRLLWTPDSRTVVQVFEPNQGIAVWDVASSKEVRRLDGHAAALSPGGRLFATAEGDGRSPLKLHLFDGPTGKELRQIEGGAGRVQALAFSTDGKALARRTFGTQTEPLIGSWDTATGQELYAPRRLSQLGVGSGTISGAWLLQADAAGRLLVYDLLTRDVKRLFAGRQGVLSPAGRLVATLGAPPNAGFPVQRPFQSQFTPPGQQTTIDVREAATGILRHRYAGHLGAETLTLAFAADGRSLVSTSQDGSILVWDLTGRQEQGRLKSADLSAERLESLWDDLASDDGAKAGKAIWALVSDPKKSVPFLRDRVEPVSPDGSRPRKLVADLDSDNLDVRRRAAEELGRLGSLAEINLRRGLEQKPSLDATRRMKELLECLDPGKAPAPAFMRTWRALEALEAIGTPEARQVLETMAKGAKPADLTRAAREALERLAAR